MTIFPTSLQSMDHITRQKNIMSSDIYTSKSPHFPNSLSTISFLTASTKVQSFLKMELSWRNNWLLTQDIAFSTTIRTKKAMLTSLWVQLLLKGTAQTCPTTNIKSNFTTTKMPWADKEKNSSNLNFHPKRIKIILDQLSLMSSNYPANMNSMNLFFSAPILYH